MVDDTSKSYADKEQEVQEKIEKKVKKWSDRNRGNKIKAYHPIEYSFTIAINIGVLYVAQNILDWHWSFITPQWADVLPVLSFSIIATIIGNIIMLLINDGVVRYIVNTALNLISLYVLYTMFSIFPFNFSHIISQQWINDDLPFIFILAGIGVIIGMIVQTTQLLHYVIINNPTRHEDGKPN